MVAQGPEANGIEWIDELSDEQYMEIFWLSVNPPEPFLQSHPPELLGQAMRFALREVASSLGEGGTA
jgi:hypothetical protein